MYNSTFHTILIAVSITTAFTLFLNGVEDTFTTRKPLPVNGPSLREQNYKGNDVNRPFPYGYGSKGRLDNGTSLEGQVL